MFARSKAAIVAAALAVLAGSVGCSDNPKPDDSDAAHTAGDIGLDTPVDASTDTLWDSSDGGDTDVEPITDPYWPDNAYLHAVPSGPTSVRLEWVPAEDDSQVAVYEVFQDGVRVARTHGQAFSYQITELDPLQEYVFEVVARDDENNPTAQSVATTFKLDVPAPADVAPELDDTRPSTAYERHGYLFEGPDPLQRDVEPGSIAERRIARISGEVVDEAGDPLAGVHISVHDRPQWGYTLTRPDGEFDLAVNGGGLLTVVYKKDGFLPVHRQVEAGWKSSDRAGRVIMIAQADAASVDPSQLSVVRGEVVDGPRGIRQGTLIFHAGTSAEMVLPDGSRQPLSTLDVRITEYTVGDDGPERMPADLPPTVAYTYAAEISVDQARAAGATSVEFNQPVPYYVENFLGFPVGIGVPVGMYNKERAVWVPEENGRVIEILSVDADGRAQVDVDGSGDPADAATLAEMHFSEGELEQLAQLYSPGDTLSRTLMEHFSTPDHNYPPGCDKEASACEVPDPEFESPQNCSQTSGSIIECHSQVLRESIPLTGVPFDLHYSTRYQYGFAEKRHGRIQMYDEDGEPRGLLGWSKSLSVEGELVPLYEDPQSPGVLEYVWDGTGRDGRRVSATVGSKLRLGFCYPLTYVRGRFASLPSGSSTGVTGATTICLYSSNDAYDIDAWSLATKQMGGWSPGVHHHFEPQGKILYRGDGTRRDLDAMGALVETVAGSRDARRDWDHDDVPARAAGLHYLKDMAFAPDGSLYFTASNFVYRLDPQDRITRVAGAWADTWGGGISSGFSGDGGAARHALLNDPQDIAVGPDYSVYIADRYNHRIRKIVAQGGPVTGNEQIITVAGSGSSSGGAYTGDGGPADQARLRQPRGIDVGPDGSIFIADTLNNAIRQVTPDGRIETVAGTGDGGFSGDGGPSRQAKLHRPIDVDFGPNGDLYILENYNDRVRKVEGGVISTVAGNNDYTASGGDGVATEIDLKDPRSITVSKDGTLFIAERNRIHVVRDGQIRMIAGGELGVSDDGTLALEAKMRDVNGLAISPDGQLHYAEAFPKLIRVLEDAFADLEEGNYNIPSADGAQLFVFNAYGRHLRTIDARSGDEILRFGYTDGLLTEVVDRYERKTRIERDTQTRLPTAVVGPYGHRTELIMYDGGAQGREGYLKEVTNPAGEKFQLDYYAYGDGAADACPSGAASTDEVCCWESGSNCEGLLKQFVEPTGATHTFSYDSFGRLTKDEGPGGFSKSLTRSYVAGSVDYSVDVTTSRGAKTSYQVEHLGEKSSRYTETYPTAQTHVRTIEGDRSSVTLPDGTQVATSLAPDPRFEMHSPYTRRLEATTPSGKSMVVTQDISVSMTDETNLLSLERHTVSAAIGGQTFQSEWLLGAGGSKTVTTTTPEGRTQTMTYDAHDRLTKVEMPGLEPIHYVYEAVDPGQGAYGRVVAMVQGDPTSSNARRWDYSYDQNASSPGYGLLDSITSPWPDPSSGQRDHAVSYDYDAALRTTRKTLPDNSAIDFGWDQNGNLSSLTPPGRSAHSFGVDQANLDDYYWPPTLSSGQSTDAFETDYEYNADYLLEKITYPDGDVVDYAYEPSSSRLASVTVPGETYDFGYDAQTGELTTIELKQGQQAVQTLGYGWDGPLLTKTTWSGAVAGSVERTYDNQFRVASRTVSDTRNPHSLSVAYKPDGMISTTGQLSLDYFTTHGLLKKVSLANTEASYTYNGFGETQTYTVTDTSQGTALFDAGYTYDALGRIDTLTETTGGQTRSFKYEYDRRGRLVEVFRRDPQSGAYDTLESYTYDANGNRTSVDNGWNTLSASDIEVDGHDRLLRYGDLEFTYTDAGDLLTKTNTTSGETTQYDYDALGNLRVVTLPDGGQIEYLVDGIQRRIGRKVFDPQGSLVGAQYWLYKDGLNPIAELDGQGRLVKRFVYASRPHVPDYLIEFDPATGAEVATYRMVTDHLGSVRMVVDTSDSSVVQRMRYDAWGNVLDDTNEGFQPFGYAGGLYDPETELVRFGARDYDPRVGRWTAKDPIGFKAGDGNLYAYVFSNPINAIDPNGLLVNGEYDKDKGTLTLTDEDTGDSVTLDVESGNKPVGDPIPNGTYEILFHPAEYNFRLDAVDESPRNDAHDPSGRDEFRLHKPGRTYGCIAAKDSGKWKQLKKLIEDTKTTTVPDNLPFNVPLTDYRPFSSAAFPGKIEKFGTLKVTGGK